MKDVGYALRNLAFVYSGEVRDASKGCFKVVLLLNILQGSRD